MYRRQGLRQGGVMWEICARADQVFSCHIVFRVNGRNFYSRASMNYLSSWSDIATIYPVSWNRPLNFQHLNVGSNLVETRFETSQRTSEPRCVKWTGTHCKRFWKVQWPIPLFELCLQGILVVVCNAREFTYIISNFFYGSYTDFPARCIHYIMLVIWV